MPCVSTEDEIARLKDKVYVLETLVHSLMDRMALLEETNFEVHIDELALSATGLEEETIV